LELAFKKTIQVCDQSGPNDNIKVNKLTKCQIDQIIKIISQNYLVDSELSLHFNIEFHSLRESRNCNAPK
jgi:ribosomal protein S13